MKAKFISGSGAEGTASVVGVGGEEIECMDCLGYGRSRPYEPGEVIHVAFSAGLLADEVSPNPERRKELQRLGGWRYRAYGEVVAVEPQVVLDCGIISVDLLEVRAAVGDFLVVEIERLDCWRARGSSS